MSAPEAATAGQPRKKRVQGRWMCGVEQLALLRCGIAVSIASMESTSETLEKNMGEQWPQQLEKAASEQGGWCEKNLRKKFEPPGVDTQPGAPRR